MEKIKTILPNEKFLIGQPYQTKDSDNNQKALFLLRANTATAAIINKKPL